MNTYEQWTDTQEVVGEAPKDDTHFAIVQDRRYVIVIWMFNIAQILLHISYI